MCQRILSFVLLVGPATGGIWSDVRKPIWIPDKYAKTEGCYINKVSRVIPYGETVQVPGYCYVMKCTTHGISYNACGIELTDDIDCDFKNIRFFKTYPECCANINCLQEAKPWRIDIGEPAKHSRTTQAFAQGAFSAHR